MNNPNKPVELWEANQGKRLIKRLHKCGVKPGHEVAFLIQALRTSAATVAIDQAKREGKTADESTALAVEAISRVKLPAHPCSHIGQTLFDILVVNGSAPGRVKSELDKVLYVAGITSDIGLVHKVDPVEPKPDVESPDYTADRFPSVPRENY